MKRKCPSNRPAGRILQNAKKKAIDKLKFPSGRTVKRYRQDAKERVNSSKLTNHPITYNAALNEISKNEINLPWKDALKKLERENEFNRTERRNMMVDAIQGITGDALKALEALRAQIEDDYKVVWTEEERMEEGLLWKLCSEKVVCLNYEGNVNICREAVDGVWPCPPMTYPGHCPFLG